MPSQWFEYKETAVSLRQQGQSLKTIHKHLGVPLSTLSGWLKHIELSEEQIALLERKKQAALILARQKAADWHRAQKSLRLFAARQEAENSLANLPLTPEVLDLALAMLYFGEGAKTRDRTTIASSDPRILQMVIKILTLNYDVSPAVFRCELHLRMDQKADDLKKYWAKELGLHHSQFTYVAFDKRSTGKATYAHYKGVCVLHCGNVAIQRKLIYLYTLFCEKIAALDLGT